jgi:hypothetical protein
MFSFLNSNRKSKKILIFLCVSVLTFTFIDIQAQTLKAQTIEQSNKNDQSSDTSQGRLELGFAAGLAVNQFTKGQPHTGLNTGVAAGFSLNYTLFKDISLQLEANFLEQGGRMILFKDDTRLGLPESLETKNVTNSSYTLNSIEVPLLLHYTLPVKQTWKPSVYIGVSYVNTFNVKEKYQKTGDLLPGEDIIATVSGSKNSSDSFNASKMNFIIGANLKLPLGSKLQLLIDMRYLNGLTPSRENYSYMDKVGFGSDIRANSFISRLGIIMPL